MATKPGRKSLADLKSLKQELEEQRRVDEARAREAARAAEEARKAAAEFRSLVGAVKPLKLAPRVEKPVAAPAPFPFKRWEDDKQVLKESISDEYGADWLIETDETLSYRRQGLGHDVVRKLRRGQWTIQSQLDLHGYRVDEAREALAEFLRGCVKMEFRCVRVIHGKGLGSVNRTPVLKEKVRRWLVQKEEVLAFVEAPPNDGGAGVVLVLLKGARV
ncbi:Smr/MutS family protein [Pigmentiphaga litoralis]|uniref:DNA-nicking Smr family endonuclease n=1 Tax=Pigmentiphaga litoralis TaxID=516702 RepID=A0A7Y9J027_9BURK|nr:Smr/MutS family protein [Pigmentiphaga litoralis]NYE26448.1 DNA-nicking Smr family endonuclease [Pigmentiphaga litoralis]NYE85568.1 DNA-nicking Smr family endonuclease [Pigmentiphaga litoralis]